MRYRARLRPEAVADVDAAHAWYEDRRPGLGGDFLAAVDDGIERIASQPWAHRVVHRHLRRVLLRRFPYALFFEVIDDTVVIVGCFHVRRDPARSTKPR